MNTSSNQPPSSITSMSSKSSAEVSNSVKPTNNEASSLNDQNNNDLEQRRHRIHEKIVHHFNKKVSKWVVNSQTRVMKRSDIIIENGTNSGSSKQQNLLEDKVYKLYQMLEDLEMELIMANSKIKSYFIGLGVRIRNTRRELRNTMENTRTPDILARYNGQLSARSRKNFNKGSSQKKARLNVKRKRSIRFSKRFAYSSDTSRQNSKDECVNNVSASSSSGTNGQELKSCLKQQQKVADNPTKCPSSPPTQSTTTQVICTQPKPQTVRKYLTVRQKRFLSTSPTPRRRRRSKLLPSNNNGVKKLPRKSTSVQGQREKNNKDDKSSKRSSKSSRKAVTSQADSNVHRSPSGKETAGKNVDKKNLKIV